MREEDFEANSWVLSKTGGGNRLNRCCGLPFSLLSSYATKWWPKAKEEARAVPLVAFQSLPFAAVRGACWSVKMFLFLWLPRTQLHSRQLCSLSLSPSHFLCKSNCGFDTDPLILKTNCHFVHSSPNRFNQRTQWSDTRASVAQAHSRPLICIFAPLNAVSPPDTQRWWLNRSSV